MRENMDIRVIYGNQIIKYEGLDKKYNMTKIPDDKINFEFMLYGNAIYGPASFSIWER